MKLSTKRENIIDDYHGVQVADPYRWLEDPDSLETKKWTDEQNERTNQYLENYHGREIIKDNITKMMNYPKYSLPTKEGKYYYFHKNNGLQNQAVFYRSKSRSEEHTSELQSRGHLVCRLLLEKKKT